MVGLAALALAQPALATSTAGPPPPRAVMEIPIYLAVDLGSHQILAARDPERTFLPASMTKVMTAYVAFELIKEGKLDPAHRLTVTPATAAIWQNRGTGLRLAPGEELSVAALLHGITTASANDASVVLAEGVAGTVADWLALMNAEARQLGMTHSHFGTPNGWPDGGVTRVSASDLIKLGRALIERHPQLYRTYFGKRSVTWKGRSYSNHDPALGVVRGADGIKTGHTAAAGYNFLGTAAREGRRIMILVAGAASEAQRSQASRELLDWGFSAWETRPLAAKGAQVGEALVQQGKAGKVALVAPHGAYVAVPRGTRPSIWTAVRYRGPLVAPIAKGTPVAQLEIAVEGQAIARVPLVAARDVGRAGPFDRLWNGLAGLFG